MAPVKRRGFSPFNLSFLDIMFCGFGAVVLLVLIINADTVSTRNEIHEDLRAEVMRLEREVTAGKEFLAELHNSLSRSEEELIETKGRSTHVLTLIEDTREELADARNQTLAEKEHVNKLTTDLKALDTQHNKLAAEITAERSDQRDKVVSFSGKDNRQYLTGLKLGGKHILILVDGSASMLADTVVNVIRRRNMDDESKRNSEKWQHTVKTAHWLLANLPKQAHFQLYAFNTACSSVLGADKPGWIAASDTETAMRAITALKKMVPAQGTSLENAISAATSLSPRPDNILLLTDGLPTQGTEKPWSAKVSGEQRIKLFQKAIRRLPDSIPVNIILFPMEGDPMAAALFWKLAIETKGSFLTPSKDWP